MSVLANEVYEYLKRTGRRMDKYRLQGKHNVNNLALTQALDQLVAEGKVETENSSGKKLYLAKRARPEPVAHKSFMRPYVPPQTLVRRQREIEQQREEFPSKFDMEESCK